MNEQRKYPEDFSSNDYIEVGLEALAVNAFEQSYERGWWDLPDSFRPDPNDTISYFKQYVRSQVPVKLALVHSEISEALEGDRKDKMDEHLPHRKSIEVELADAVIRIADLAGALGLDLGGAVLEKMAYNAKRADHNRENRAAEGGKSY